MKQNILITGSSGFIGKNLVEKLKDKYELLTPPHSELELTNSITVKDYFKCHKIDTVIHCASRLEKGRRESDKNHNIVKENLQMFFNILNNSTEYNKLINCGTGGEYGREFEVKKVKETEFDKNIPREDYSFSKYIISKYIENSQNKVINLRLFAVFGKYEDYNSRFISNAICKNILNLPITIKQNVFFDYIYVNDIVRIMEYFIQKNPSEKIYNVGTGKPIDLLTLAKKINQIGDFESKIIIEKEGLNKEFSCDNKKLINEIRDFEFTSIDKAIKNLYEYYKENIKNLNLKN